jgi:hypothetical protein
MNGVLKGILVALIIVYIVSPVDFCPGPIDDIILLLFSVCGGTVARKIEN